MTTETQDAGGKIAVRLSEIAKAGGLRRVMEVGAIDKDARTVELSFSSEVEYERWFGMEILSHDPAHVDLARLSNKAPVLWMHEWRDQRGVVESVQIVDRKGRAVLRFSKSPAGDQLFQDIIDGIITKVSVGYRVHGMQLLEMREDIDVFLVNAWEPFEISMVSVPADDTVGVGRSADPITREEPPANAADTSAVPEQRADSQPPRKEVIRMDEDDVRPGTPPVVDAKAIVQAERQRHADMTRMGKEAGAEELAAQFIADGKSPAELQRALFDKFVKERSSQPLAEQERGAEIGMSDKDVKRFSIFRAVRALANPNDKSAQKAAAFELECSRAAAEQYGKEARGILIPQDVLSRAFNAGGAANTPAGATSGANVVATELLAGSFIEMLRNRTALLRRATTMGGLVGNLEIPKQTGGATGYWIAEGGDATEGTPVIGQIAMSPKTVAAYTDITRRLMMQSTPDAEGIVRRDLLNALAQTIDFAGYYGTGASNQPRGIKNYTGLNAVDFATAAKPTFAELVDMETQVALDNADVNAMAYMGNAGFRGHAKTTPKFGSGTEATIWEQGNTVNGYTADITNQIAAGDVFFGNFADLVVGMWGGLDLIVDTSTLSKSGGTRIVVFQDVDFALRRVESLCYGSATVTP